MESEFSLGKMVPQHCILILLEKDRQCAAITQSGQRQVIFIYMGWLQDFERGGKTGWMDPGFRDLEGVGGGDVDIAFKMPQQW